MNDILEKMKAKWKEQKAKRQEQKGGESGNGQAATEQIMSLVGSLMQQQPKPEKKIIQIGNEE